MPSIVQCCKEMTWSVEESTMEYDAEIGSVNVGGCCGGGCYVLMNLKYCPFCGKKIEVTKNDA